MSPPVLAAPSLRCGARIIAVADLAPAVLALCGEPAFRDVQTRFDPAQGYAFNDVEVWTYNPGPNRLLRELRFRNGQIVEIQTDGYGFYPAADPQCTAAELREGLSKYRLLSACGEPVARRELSLLSPRLRSGSNRVIPLPGNLVVAIYREEWTYNLGPDSRLSKVVLENGRVVRVDDAGRGY